MWNALRGYDFKLLRLAPAKFIHFGTTKEILRLMNSGVNEYADLGWSGSVNSTRKVIAGYNSVISPNVDVGKGIRGSMSSRCNKPFMLKPAAKDYLWGGRRLNDDFGKGIQLDPLAEIWDFIERVKQESVLFGDEVNRDVAIVYSPLNGTGLKPVTRILSESGYTNITVVEEQRNPDGNFPTCPYPNPEIREAMKLGLQYCEKVGADLLLATDPDCDRCGIAVKDGDDYRLLSGNEVGVLLLDYICSQRVKHGKIPADPVFIKTIVTMDLAERIAAHYGVRTINVLTGFKFIGEQIGYLEAQGQESSYICGFEESYGYLTGSYVRDKDAVNAAFMICEMFAYYKTRGISLLEKLDARTFYRSVRSFDSYSRNLRSSSPESSYSSGIPLAHGC